MKIRKCFSFIQNKIQSKWINLKQKWKELENHQQSKLIFSGIMLFMLIGTIGISYALFSVVVEKESTFNIIVGDLKYQLSSNDLDSNRSIQVKAWKAVVIDLDITSLNEFDTRYKIYYEGVTNDQVKVSYYKTDDYTGMGQLSKNDRDNIQIVIENNSTSDVTIQFGVQGGFINNTLTLNQGKELTEFDGDVVVTYDYSGNNTPNGFPQKNSGYVATRLDCRNADGIWNSNKWEVTINSITGNGAICTVYFKDEYKDSSGANTPKLVDGMIPVVYDETSKKWKKTDLSEPWYDYNQQKWANAVTVTEDTRNKYMNAEVGTEISMNDINTMWVWIPRYSYTINRFNGKGESCSKITNPSYEKNKECYVYNILTQEENLAYFILDYLHADGWNPNIEEGQEILDDAKVRGTVIYFDPDRGKYEADLETYIEDFNMHNPDTPVTYEFKFDPNRTVATLENPGEIDVIFTKQNEKLNGIAKYTSGEASNYLTHPAFTFDNKELPGIWYAKFETTGTLSTSCSTDRNCDTSQVTIKPGLPSLTSQTITSFFYMSRSMQLNNSNIYGFNPNSGNLHVSKNVEWGSVAYLSQSRYGKYGNPNYQGSNKEVYQNMSSITGNSNGTPSTDVTNEQVSYDTPNTGYGASTTGTIYGVYDMNGGVLEYVMGNLYNLLEGAESLPELKYYDLYNSADEFTACDGKICYGHALTETSNWYIHNDYFVNNMEPWMVRGDVFSYYRLDGLDHGYSTTRLTITP